MTPQASRASSCAHTAFPERHLSRLLAEAGPGKLSDVAVVFEAAAEQVRWIEVTMSRITQVLIGHRSITGDTALWVGRPFATSGEFWPNLQKFYEMGRAEGKNGRAIAYLPSLDDGNRLWD